VNFDWGGLSEAAWRSAVMLVPIVAAIALLCRFVSVRPVTRHALWLGAIAWLCIGPWLPTAPSSSEHIANLFKSEAEKPRTPPETAELPIEQDQPHMVMVPDIIEPADEPEAPAQFIPEKLDKTGWLKNAWTIARHRFLAGLDHWKAAPPPKAAAVETDTILARTPSHMPKRPAIALPANDTAGAPTIATVQSPTTDDTSPTEKVLTGLLSFGKQFFGALSTWAQAAWKSVKAIITWPALPGEWWLAGICAVTALQGVRLIRFRARLGSASPADLETHALVRTCASELGLNKLPHIGMIAARVSPMVWCMGRPHLLLPIELWSQLDDLGRRAVVLHELAHLRRRDHWVRRLETLAGVAYWWHPMVWGIRSRLNEEADLCCDQWVTALLPNGRATYARALLETKKFVGDGAGPMPAAAIGAISGRFTRLSRRLTMIMTDTHSPRRSMGGLALVLGLMISGWLATPAFSGDAPPAVAAVEGSAANYVVAVPVAPVAATEALGAVVIAAGDNDDIDARMDRLERQMNELMSKLDHLGVPPSPPGTPLPTSFPRMRALAPRRAIRSSPAAQSGEDIVSRNYLLPEGKLKALTELMIREDVPIKVSPGAESITVMATPEQHEHFEAFIEMINPDGDGDDHAHTPQPHGHGSSHPGAMPQQRASMELLRNKMQKLRHEFKSKHEKTYRKQILGSMHKTAEALGKQAEALERAAENLERKSHELREKADSIRESQEQGKGDDESMSHAADELSEQAEAIDAQAQSVRSEMESVQDCADAAQDEADQLDEQMVAGEEEHEEDEGVEG
jgi:beta-lactamase regulating signal transducer with metallopeptidase domain/cytochrome c556